jgi:DNA-binding response OmpR family regulator
MDWNLPGLEKWALLRQVQTAAAGVLVVVMTGKDQPGLKERVIAEGASAFMVKPMDGMELLQTLRNIMLFRPA